MTGSVWNDVLLGNRFTNELVGNSGDDWLDGRGGDDVLQGESGDDTYVVDSAGDLIFERSFSGYDTVLATTSYTLAARVQVERLSAYGAADSAAINLTGNEFDNFIVGNAGANSLIGKGGNDILRGGAGNDLLDGGDGADWADFSDKVVAVSITLNGATSVAVKVNGIAEDTIASIENVKGGSANDVLRGDSGSNELAGLEGNDTLFGGLGVDFLDGGAGAADWADYSDKSAAISVEINGATNAIVNVGDVAEDVIRNIENLKGGSSNDTLRGDGLANELHGQDGNDSLWGGAGDDVLDGGASGDTMVGGAGNDQYMVDAFADLVTELADGGIDTVFSAVNWTLGTFVERLTLTGEENLRGDGNDLSNILIGNAGNNVLDGRGAADTMAGGFGSDTYFVDAVGDVIVEAVDEGVDTVFAWLNWTLGANLEYLYLEGTADLKGTGNDLNNVLFGNAGNNVLNGAAGADMMFGAQGNDTYIVDHAGDAVIESTGNGIDLVQSSVSYRLGGNVENLVLTGKGSIDGTGNELANVLAGNAGNNTLDGGAGADAMLGGAGNDTYVVDNAGDVVTEQIDGGIDTVLSSVNWTLGAHVERLTLTGTSDLMGTGNDLNNVLTGNSGNNALSGAAGDDTIDGKAGADTMAGGLGDDSYYVDDLLDNVIEAASAGTDRVLAGVSHALAQNVENLVLTGTASINGTGNGLANVLTGNSGNNVLDGAAGADTMAGGLGDDSYVVDNAGDVVTELANGGIDTVLASVDWTLGANVEKLTLTGAANLAGTGNELANTLTGNTGNNRLNGAAGADAMAGGLGNDTYVVDAAGDVVTENAVEGTDTVEAWLGWTLGVNLEQLRLMGTADLNGTGNTVDNELWGNAGKNVLDGKAGADTMAGGLGDDTYLVDVAGDVVTEAAGEGTDTVETRVDWTLGANLERLVLAGTSNLKGTGNALANTLTGNSGNNLLDGGAGADTMAGGLGNDTYLVDNALDVVSEGEGAGVDTVLSSLNWTLAANVERLTLTGTAHRSGTGNGLANTLTGNAGNNLLDGGAGADTMAGGLGDDTYIVDDAGDVTIEDAAAGIDTVQSSITLRLRANLERLVLTGEANINGTGNELANVLTGNAGNNVLDGGAGADSMTGGLGDDTYVVDDAGDRANENPGGGIDTVLSSLSHTLRANLEKLVLTGAAAINGYGNGEANTLTGNGAANILDGRAGADTMEGRGGNDTYLVDDAGDVVIEAVGGGADEVQSSVSHTLSANVERLKLVGSADIDGTGNGLANNLVGNAGDNRLDGGAGADTMSGGLGDDTYIIDHAQDLANENPGGGIDTVLSSISHSLKANLEKLVLTGNAALNGNGNGEANTLTGNGAANVLDGRAGADTMIGGGGDDTYVIDDAGDVVVEAAGGGTDMVQSWVSHALGANVERLKLFGTAAIDATGNELANVLMGNSDHNLLDGGLGADTLNGGGGGDTFRFSTALGPDNVDRIAAFDHAADTIQLDQDVFAGLGLGALGAGAFNLGAAATQADDRILFHAGSKSLYYDADGLGGAAAVKFATIDALTGTLDHTDFLIV